MRIIVEFLLFIVLRREYEGWESDYLIGDVWIYILKGERDSFVGKVGYLKKVEFFD